MNAKTTAPRPVKAETQLPDDLKTAYQVHTLVQMLYVRLSAAPEWTAIAQPPFPPVLH